ncbi:hypothetical protein F0562_001824 [Nyssa sinensis]|uniref:Chromo domain-containing protein n=1 Tax=Nyssa sinensis TaxID=561372 RepID=A0A5J5C850_9ASTE|nr:hypothetical protein F0562_001824 [Nyssa sinensis]
MSKANVRATMDMEEKNEPEHYGMAKSVNPVIYKAVIAGDINGLMGAIDPELSSLKQKVGESNNATIDFPLTDDEGVVVLQTDAILDTRWVKKGSRFVEESLVKWKRLPVDDATWEETAILQDQFINMNLENKVPVKDWGISGACFTYERLKSGNSIVHATIGTRNREVLDKLLRFRSSLIDSVDENGRTPLSYAASIGYLDGICCILDLKAFTECTYNRDRDGFYPIHMASRNGHINVIQEFLRRCQDSRELLNPKGQNILHVTAENGRANAVSYMLKISEVENLIYERDKDGNTALHLASRCGYPKIVSILT